MRWQSLTPALLLAVALNVPEPAAAVACNSEIARLMAVNGIKFDRQRDATGLFRELSAMTPDDFNDWLQERDQYASYLTSDEVRDLEKLRSQAGTSGVGMDIFLDRDNRVRCVPYPGSPAARAGVHYGHELVTVDGENVDDMSIETIAGLIQGSEGSTVRLGLEDLKTGRATAVNVTRASGSYAPVAQTERQPVTIRIYRFSAGTSGKLRTLLQKLNLPARAQLTLDLRGNTGGILDEGVACAELFLKAGEITHVQQDRRGTQTFKASRSGPGASYELTVLQDELTASAAEVMIAALRSSGRAVLRGSRTAGKAEVQEVFRLTDGAAIKVTVSELLYPNDDRGWQDRGISPDEGE